MSSLNVKYNNDKSRDYTNPTLPSGDGDHLPLSGELLPSLLLAARPALARDRLTGLCLYSSKFQRLLIEVCQIYAGSDVNAPCTVALTGGPGVLAPSFGLGLGGPYAGAAVAAGLPGFGALALAQGALSGATPSLRALPQPLPMATVLLVSNLNEEVHVFFVTYYVLSMICSRLKMSPLIKDIFEKSRA